jgi:hypothetical protein
LKAFLIVNIEYLFRALAQHKVRREKNMKQKEVELKIYEAFQTDVGYGRARINSQTKLNLDLSEGEVIEIEGTKITAAVVYPHHHADEEKRIIRIDNLTRKNAGVEVGEIVKVRKAKVRKAKMLAICPLISRGHQIQFGSGIDDVIKKGLYNRPLKKGDRVIISGIVLFGVSLPFVIISTIPMGIVSVCEETKIKVEELNLNLSESEIAENALKEQMFTMLLTDKRVAIDFNNYLKTLEKEGKCYFLPFQIRKVHIKNVGVHSDLKLNFGAYNIIQGYHGSGKSSLIKFIAKTFGYDNVGYEKLLSPGQNPHAINVTIRPENHIDIAFDEQKQGEFNENRTTRCIIMDEPTSRLSSNLKKEFLQYLADLNTQIILTCTPDDKIEFSNDFRVSRLSKDDKKE